MRNSIGQFALKMTFGRTLFRGIRYMPTIIRTEGRFYRRVPPIVILMANQPFQSKYQFTKS